MVQILTLASLILLTACQWMRQSQSISELASTSVYAYRLDHERVQASLRVLTAAPHPMGTQRQHEIRNFLVHELKSLGLKPELQIFTAKIPNKHADNSLAPLRLPREAANVSVRLNLNPNANCVVALASHYDSKDIEGFPYLGANDGGSSSALLLDLARFLSKNITYKLQCDIQLIWFDGEEANLEDWNDGLLKHPSHSIDNTYGSRYLANTLRPCKHLPNHQCFETQDGAVALRTLIVLDMVGYENLQLTHDQNSHPLLLQWLYEAAKVLEQENIFSKNALAIVDDHIPFRAKGIPVLDIIDFNHMDLWHTPRDQIETVDSKSLELSGKLALYGLLRAAQDPKLLDSH